MSPPPRSQELPLRQVQKRRKTDSVQSKASVPPSPVKSSTKDITDIEDDSRRHSIALYSNARAQEGARRIQTTDKDFSKPSRCQVIGCHNRGELLPYTTLVHSPRKEVKQAQRQVWGSLSKGGWCQEHSELIKELAPEVVVAETHRTLVTWGAELFVPGSEVERSWKTANSLLEALKEVKVTRDRLVDSLLVRQPRDKRHEAMGVVWWEQYLFTAHATKRLRRITQRLRKAQDSELPARRAPAISLCSTPSSQSRSSFSRGTERKAESRAHVAKEVVDLCLDDPKESSIDDQPLDSTSMPADRKHGIRLHFFNPPESQEELLEYHRLTCDVSIPPSKNILQVLKDRFIISKARETLDDLSLEEIKNLVWRARNTIIHTNFIDWKRSSDVMR